MKLGGRELAAFLARPDPACAALLLYGADAERVSMTRREVAAALTGAEAQAEMRLTRLSGGDLRKDPAALSDAILARGFFPGPRAVILEEATDALAPVVMAALAGWRADDAVLIVTSGALPPKSALRKAFESHPSAVAIGLYDDPPRREEVVEILRRAGVSPDREAMAELLALARDMAPGDFRQLAERISLYVWGEGRAVTPADIAAVAPQAIEAEADDLLHAVAESRTRDAGLLLRRLSGQGMAPVTLVIAAIRHFRVLHMAASDPDGAAAALARARPPVPFRARDRMQAQAQSRGMRGTEEALRLLIETDLGLRSSSRAPGMAVLERALLRLSEMGRRG